jgi:hypothetical protein
MKCRDVQKEFSLPDRNRRQASDGNYDRLGSAVEQHLSECPACASEYRLVSLGRAVLGLAGTGQPVRPDDDWFAVLKAKIARQPEAATTRVLFEESWPGLVWVTARQLIPIMAAVMAIILGASLFWRTNPVPQDRSGVRASDRFVFSGQVYEYPQPTRDDVIETLVAVEDQKNGK